MMTMAHAKHPLPEHHPQSDQESIQMLETFQEEEDETTTSVEESNSNPKEAVRIAQNESRAVSYLRLILFGVIILVAFGVSFAVYYFTRSNEQEDFERQYKDHARKIVRSFQTNAARRLKAMDELAFTISSYASSENMRWPNVTLPDFEQRVQYTLDLADVISITMMPLVTNETRLGWEEYSVAHQDWFTEGLEVQAAQQAAATEADTADEEESLADLSNIVANSEELQIPEQIIRIEGTGTANETGPGPFLPWWQFAPVIPFSSVVNYNTLSHPTRVDQLETVMRTHQTLVSKAWDYRDTEDEETVGRKAVLNLFLNRWRGGSFNYEDGPVSDVYVPIFDSVEVKAKDKKLVAMLTAYVYWQPYFQNILIDRSGPLLATLEATCGGDVNNQAFTYRIKGEHAEYVGPGDRHDTKYNHLEISTGYPAFLQGTDATVDNLLDGQCLYNVRVYPTQEMEDSYATSTPVIFTVVIVATFLFTSGIFILYDWLVEHRQKIVLKKAVQSTEVVNTLFPENVRERLYEENEAMHHSSDTATMKKKLGEFASEHSKLSADMDGSGGGGGAIADVYENCTVLFADIAGFTKWSSGREPTQVFQLLEALYGAMDRIAIRRRVFKIETIGDCYLAVTGLPNPQRDHAVIMTKFAVECLTKMNQLVHDKLVNTLGGDTLNLTMRFGLHSGPVTAGVLRGERARFQLFGDTVNTAARMESTGIPGKIQASMATANLLVAAGKGSWIVPREGGVEAKGKGTMETVWLQPAFDRPMSVSTFHTQTVSDSYNSGGRSPVVDLEQGGGAIVLNDSSVTSSSKDEDDAGINWSPSGSKLTAPYMGVPTDVEV